VVVYIVSLKVGVLHDAIEGMQSDGFYLGYYVYNFKTMAGHQHLFAQLWKEYAYSDSRYLTQDPFVLCMETITAVCPPPSHSCLSIMLIILVGHMGPSLLPRRLPNPRLPSSPPPTPNHCLARSDVWRHLILWHEHV
jgi:hypothetical protein